MATLVGMADGRQLRRSLLVFLLAGVAVTPAFGQTGEVEGRVIDGQTQAPLAGVEIRVEGTDLRAVTGADGRYRLAGVPAGSVRVSAMIIGYEPVRQALQLQGGQTATVEFALKRSVFSLEAVVVTATGGERRRESGNAIATIDAAVVQESQINTVTDLLTGRAAGVQVLPSEGTTGMGARVRIRGANSVSLSNEPIVYVDGVRISAYNDPVSYETGGAAPSRLNDLDPNSIESIEVVKGPSAATLYGTDAANGVLWITTKRGRSGAPRWQAYAQGGAVVDPYTYPASYRAVAANGTECRLFDVAAGACTQARIDSLSPLEAPALSPFRTGSVQEYGANVAGGTEALRYFLAGDLRSDNGVLPNNDLARWQLRGNFDVTLAPTFNVGVSTAYLASELGFPLNGNYELGVLGNGLASQGTTDILGGWGFFPLEQLFSVDSRQNIDRFTGSVRLNWAPLAFLSGRATIGLDQISRRDEQFFPTGQAPAFIGFDQGALFDNRFEMSTSTVDLLSTARFQLSPRISSETSVGGQYIRDLIAGTLTTGQQLVAGSRSISSAAVTSGRSETTENVKVGVFVQQKLGFGERLWVTAAARADDASAFGKNFNTIIYPKLSASWVLSEEPFFPEIRFLNSLRLRTAFGESGLQPGPTDALRFLRPVPVTVAGQSTTGVTFGSLGNPSLRPERSREIEVGFGAQAFDGRGGLELTYFDKRTRDALVFRQLPPSLGTGGGRFENLGSVRNSGLEALLVARVVDKPSASWALTLNAAVLSNELERLGQGIPPIILSGNQRHVQGYPLGAYWDLPILDFNDANGDGIIAASEVNVGTSAVFLGTPFPKRQLSIRSDLDLFSRLRLGVLLDFRGGNKLHNNTASWRDGQNITRAMNDPTTPLADQARAVASKFLGTDAGYIEDASFWKLREVSLAFQVPQAWVARLGAQRLSLVLAGRNLATWTNYTGPDPEVNQIGQSNFLTRDFMNQAPVRYWTVRLNFSY